MQYSTGKLCRTSFMNLHKLLILYCSGDHKTVITWCHIYTNLLSRKEKSFLLNQKEKKQNKMAFLHRRYCKAGSLIVALIGVSSVKSFTSLQTTTFNAKSIRSPRNQRLHSFPPNHVSSSAHTFQYFHNQPKQLRLLSTSGIRSKSTHLWNANGMTPEANGDLKGMEPKVYPQRWIQLGYLSLLALLSDWICFAVAAAPSTFENAYPGHSAASLLDLFLFTNVASCFGKFLPSIHFWATESCF